MITKIEYYILLFYLFIKDPIHICSMRRKNFDEYSSEVTQIIRSVRTYRDIQTIFRESFAGHNCPIDNKIVKSIFIIHKLLHWRKT